MSATSQSASETYDQNGNVTATGGKTFTYDSQNQLISMGGTVTITYDGDSNRVAKTASGTVTRYLVDELNPTGYAQVVEELTSGAVTRTYTYGLQRISQEQVISSAWTPSFYGYDEGGNVRQLTNAAGTVTDTNDFDAFGNLVNYTGSTPNDYMYRGEQFDSDLGFYYLRARYYNPLAGRFVSVDSLAGQGQKRYEYADADPVNEFDPSGNAAIAEFLLLQFRGSTAIPFPRFNFCDQIAPILGPILGLLPFCDANDGVGGSGAGQGGYPPPCPKCWAQLKYRHAASIWNHAFWWVQARNGEHYVIDGGPNKAGNLWAWITQGDNGPPNLSGDIPSAPTWFSSDPQSNSVCDQVERMIGAVGKFLRSEPYDYDYFPSDAIYVNHGGVNSNSFARWDGAQGGFYPSAPPNTPDWPNNGNFPQ